MFQLHYNKLPRDYPKNVFLFLFFTKEINILIYRSVQILYNQFDIIFSKENKQVFIFNKPKQRNIGINYQSS